MAPRHNPRRNVGAPVRFEDDETYLIERPRDSSKPAWPKLLAQSTVPYDHTLSPVKWNTRPLDQPSLQIPKQAPENFQEAPAHDTRKEEDFSKQFAFESHDDLDMATSESESEDGDDDHERSESDQTIVSIVPTWSALEPALQLSMYEYVYRFIEGQKENELVRSQKKDEIRAKAAELLGLSNHELSDIEPQREFRTANPLSEEYLQEQWWKEEEATVNGEDLLSKDACQHRDRWQAINDRYVTLMAHICKYKYANERAIKLAKAYLKAHALKPKVVGKWTEGEEETTMILVSTQAADPKSPMLLPVSRYSAVPRDSQPLPNVAVPAVGVASRPPPKSATSVIQTQPSSRPHLSSLEITSAEGFAKRDDPKLVRPRFAQEYPRGRSPVRPSDIHLRVNSNGKAEIRKKRSKRRTDSELRPSYPSEHVGGQRIVVRADGIVGFDVDTKLTPEVEGLLQTGIEASRRGNATSPTSRMQESAKVPSSAPKARPCRFSDVLLEIDSDHMPTTTAGNIATNGQERQLLSLTSTPRQLEWSPLASPSPSPSPIKSTLRMPKEAIAKSTSVAATFTPLRSVEAQLKSESRQTEAEERSPVLLDFHTIVRDIASSRENQLSPEKPSSRYKRSLSVPLLAPDPINDDHDSGIGTSRATSTEPDVSNRVMGVPPKTQKPKPKQPEQLGSHKVTQSNRKIGKGARGGPGCYKKKQKTAKELPAVAASPLVEKTNIGTSGGTSHAV